MTVAVSITVKEKNPGELARRLDQIVKNMGDGPRRVKVGFPAGRADATVIAYATYNHFGTSRGIPARPFITIAMRKGRDRIRDALRQMLRSMLAGRYDLRTGLERLGQLGQQLIQQQISSNTPPPLNPNTIRQKGSSRTLIDTGRMRQSVTYEVE